MADLHLLTRAVEEERAVREHYVRLGGGRGGGGGRSPGGGRGFGGGRGPGGGFGGGRGYGRGWSGYGGRRRHPRYHGYHYSNWAGWPYSYAPLTYDYTDAYPVTVYDGPSCNRGLDSVDTVTFFNDACRVDASNLERFAWELGCCANTIPAAMPGSPCVSQGNQSQQSFYCS